MAAGPAPAPVAVVATPVAATPRLRISKRGPATVRAGGTARFRIRVANVGAGDARAIRVVDVLPIGFALERRDSPRERLASGRPTWRMDLLRAGHSRTVFVTVRALPGVRGGRCNRARAALPGGPAISARACFRIHAARPRRTRPAVTG